MTNIALVDDHVLIRASLAAHINTYKGYRVVIEARNGKHFTELLDPENIPGLVLLDINMPEMNGFDTALWITIHHPEVKIIALSMLADETAIIKMLRHGAKGYILKDAEITELKIAIDAVMNKGIYINRLIYSNIIHTIHEGIPRYDQEYQKAQSLNEREKEFLQWLCTDKCYKEIAAAMFVGRRTIDGYRDSLFEKLHVASRIGLVTFAIRNHIVHV